jgi:hypothetical protein
MSKLLSKAEIAKIRRTAGTDKRRLNYETYINQLLDHVDALTGKVDEVKKDEEPVSRS